ncbi:MULTISPECIES: transporter substrate-binding domain-containing protein [Kordiimonas]|jgi:hypothetical protein|uniref:transporter substrate-binding domain-containing protein n=1 Tax=Kordiimonas TaxID=288021 RepID=UPI00257CF4FF|nr:transporter substrate-binding domain-containing protein [Kordiimonas sp. UBA4487]
MGRFTIILGFLVALADTLGAAHADTPVTVVVQEMPGLIEPDKQLPYNRLLDALLEDAPVATSIEILPGYRGPRQWLRFEHQCVFGGVSAPGHQRPRDTAISKTDWSTLHISTPFNILNVHALTRDGDEPAHSLADLKSQTIAVDQVLFFDLRFHSDVLKASDFVKVDTAQEALTLLTQGRVDHVFAYDNDVALMQEKSAARFAYDPALTLLELEESMMCWSGGDVADLIDHINVRLKDMTQSGALKELLPSLR